MDPINFLTGVGKQPSQWLAPELANAKQNGLEATPIDWAVLDKVAASAADQTEILLEFVGDTVSDLAGLTAAVSQNDLAASMRIAHCIKGASGMVGARELAAASAALEKLARQGISGGLEPVTAAFSRLAAYLDTTGYTNRQNNGLG